MFENTIKSINKYEEIFKSLDEKPEIIFTDLFKKVSSDKLFIYLIDNYVDEEGETLKETIYNKLKDMLYDEIPDCECVYDEKQGGILNIFRELTIIASIDIINEKVTIYKNFEIQKTENRISKLLSKKDTYIKKIEILEPCLDNVMELYNITGEFWKIFFHRRAYLKMAKEDYNMMCYTVKSIDEEIIKLQVKLEKLQDDEILLNTESAKTAIKKFFKNYEIIE